MNRNFRKTHYSLLSALFASIAIIAACGVATVAQPPAQHTEGKSDQTLRGSGRVNPSTLAMEFSLSLGNYPGTGINLPVSISYSSKLWRLQYVDMEPTTVTDCHSVNLAVFAERTASGWTSSLGVPYIEYTGVAKYNGMGEIFNDSADLACNPHNGPDYTTKYYIKRVTFHLPSGETHELRASDTPQAVQDFEGTFYAADGSNIKYIQDSANGIFKVQMPDGSFYTMNPGSGTGSRSASKFTDRNGNHIDFHLPDSAHADGYWTDTLGRTIDLPFGTAPPSPTTIPYEYHLPGLGGSSITYKFHWKSLKGGSEGESALTHFSDSLKYYTDRYFDGSTWQMHPAGTFLFPSEIDGRITPSTALFNPVLLTEIELPNGQSYKFSYNVYGEIDTITYPTGGVEKFEYDTVAAVSFLEAPFNTVNRGVVDRKVYLTANDAENDVNAYEWTYSSQTGSTTTVNPDGTTYERYMHKSSGFDEFGFGEALDGMPYEERTYTSDDHLVLRKLTHWIATTLGTHDAQWHPRVDYEEAIVYDSAGNGLSAVTKHEYSGDLSAKETPLLENKTTNYAFGVKTDGASFTPGQGPSSPPTIPTVAPTTSIRSSEVTYLIDDPNYSSVKSNYTSQNINSLVTIAKVKDSSGNIVSQSETVYDESGRSPGYRGNPTTAKAWDSTKGTATNPAAYIATSATFDQYGNKVSATDALGNTTTTTYDTTYHAFPESVTTPVPDPSGQHGSSTAFTTSATFDWATGLPLTTTDVNGLKTSIEYDPATLRPRYTRYYDGSTQIGPTNETIYHDETGNVWVKSRAQIDTNKFAETITYFDGLGRAWKTETTDSGGNIFTEKEFDSFGRVSRVCNPYRVGEAKVWTTNVYDTSSRVVEVDFPDASTITTAYGVSTSGIVGLTKTITDQAGKKRKGYTDASGNMVRVIEDPSGTALTTDYTFDTLGNLRKTAQGSQYRYFYHDSLGRLLYARQVEQLANPTFSGAAFTDPITGNNQWSVKYEYNDSGSIVSTTDANNAAVSAEYDHLNRITKRTYTGSTTPNVDFYYDGKYFDADDTAQTASGAVKGKTTGIKSTVSKTNFTAFDLFGRPTSHQQITDGTTYTTGYAYNLSGALIEETYPSGRVVKSTLDENGDLSQIQSKKNAASGYWTYADAISRDSAGNVTKMQLGNGLWETASYNDRSQVTMIGLGTTDSAQNLLKLDYSYATTGVHDNNGSLREQKVTVPTVGTNAGFTATQSYTYDDLNRLVSAVESVSGAQTWKQTFQYDRFGNRRFNAANTTTLGSCSQVLCNPMISTATNRISESGYSYDANGSLTANAAGERFGYDGEGHQTEFFAAANQGSNPDAEYTYDGEGRRVKKVSAAETTIFVYDASGVLIAEYSGEVASEPRVSYLTTDHLGSPRVVTDERGSVASRRDFTAFGEESFTAQRTLGLGYQPTEIRQNYTGYEKDEESGLEFAQARYYNPTHGRFTSVDPLTASATIRNPQTLNRYSYALNSPYKFTDPLGLLSEYTTGACGNRCLNSDGGSGGGWIGSSFGMGADWVESVPNPPESHTNAPSNTPATQSTTASANASALGNGPVTAMSGNLTIFGREISGAVSLFGDLEVTLDLNSLSQEEATKVLDGGVGFSVSIKLDTGNSKNAVIPTKFADSEEVGRPAYTKTDGTEVPAKMVTEKRYVEGTSRVVTSSSSSSSNVRASRGGEITFSDESGRSATATFQGSFNAKPDPSRSSSFHLSIFSKRSDYASREESNFTVRILITPRR